MTNVREPSSLINLEAEEVRLSLLSVVESNITSVVRVRTNRGELSQVKVKQVTMNSKSLIRNKYRLYIKKFKHSLHRDSLIS